MFQAQVIGNLGADAEVVESNGSRFITLSIADTRKFKKQDGTEVSQTTWLDAIISNVDHPVLPYLKQGVKVCVTGNVTLRVYSSKKDRMMKAGATIHVLSIELCGGSSDNVPRRLIDPDTAQVFDTTKYYWINVDTKGMKKDDMRLLVDEKGNRFLMNKLGFVVPEPQPQAEQGAQATESSETQNQQ